LIFIKFLREKVFILPVQEYLINVLK